jgi:hypothetical protein
MASSDPDRSIAGERADGEPTHDWKAEKLRRFTSIVTAALIVLCNAVFLLGLWGSGINLESLVRTPDFFDPAKDVCLRLGWHRVAGIDDPIRLCNEWIQLSDPSGETHKFRQDTKIVKGTDGRLYFDHGARVDYRLLLYGGFVAAVIVFGIMVKRFLIARYRIRLDMSSERAS